MERYRALIIMDLRHAWKDPVLMALCSSLLLFLSRFGFPVAVNWLDVNYSFHLEPYSGFAASLLIVTIPMLTGMLTGLLILDERDENVIAYYAVTPLMRKGYLLYRVTLPFCYAPYYPFYICLFDFIGYSLGSIGCFTVAGIGSSNILVVPCRFLSEQGRRISLI